jgi:large subunit ribosomal protein L31
MKAEIHPDYHDVKVVMTDGTEYTIGTTWGKPGDVLRLDIDPLNHPAWNGGASKVIEKGRMEKFKNRYGNFMGGASADDAAKE